MEFIELFEDEDEEILEFLNYQRRVYTIRERINHMVFWDDQVFRVRFRLSKKSSSTCFKIH